MMNLLMFVVYIISTMAGMLAARLGYSSVISLKNKRERLIPALVKSSIISMVLILITSSLKEPENLEMLRYQMISLCIVVGFMVQRERSQGKITEYVLLEKEFEREIKEERKTSV